MERTRSGDGASSDRYHRRDVPSSQMRGSLLPSSEATSDATTTPTAEPLMTQIPLSRDNSLRSGSSRRRHRRKTSRGSYSTVTSQETELDRYRDDDGESGDDDYEDEPQSQPQSGEDDENVILNHPDLGSYLSGERSPLHSSSFDNDDRGENNDGVQNMYAVSSSFGFDDDDDEDDDVFNIQRYAIDFSSKDHLSSPSFYASHRSSPQAHSSILRRIPANLWFRFQTVRQQARQRRAQLLLQQSDYQSGWHRSLYVLVLTVGCDATDAGILLAATGLVTWFLLLAYGVGDSVQVAVWGSLVFGLRFGARPFHGWLLQQRQKWRRRRFQRRNNDYRQPTSQHHESPRRVASGVELSSLEAHGDEDDEQDRHLSRSDHHDSEDEQDDDEDDVEMHLGAMDPTIHSI